MRPAQQPDSIHGRLAAHRPGIVMVELQETPLAAPAPVRSDPSAAVAVPLPHRAPHAGRDVPGVQGLPPATPRSLGGRELLPLQLADEQPEGAVEDLVQVPARNRVAEQVLRAPKAVAVSRR